MHEKRLDIRHKDMYIYHPEHDGTFKRDNGWGGEGVCVGSNHCWIDFPRNQEKQLQAREQRSTSGVKRR